MPRTKQRRSNNNSKQKERNGTSDEDSVNDNASVSSFNSEIRSVAEDGNEEVDEQAQAEHFEDEFNQALDNLLEKSIHNRDKGFDFISKTLSFKYDPEFISSRRMTIQEAIERCLKRGRDQEQSKALQLLALMCIQLGSFEINGENPGKYWVQLLSNIAFDKTISESVRSKCCSSLALSAFLCTDFEDILGLMEKLERIFAGSYLKGDSTAPVITPEEAHLHASALSAWSLLFTLVPPSEVYSLMSSENSFMPQIDHLTTLLESCHLEVRMAAGDAIALVYELGRNHDNQFREEFETELCEKLHDLATDSHKYRAKKDRKQQRSSFRDILHFIQDGNFPDMQVRFGQEMLPLDSWSRKRQYDTFCHILGSGINFHLTENDLLRDVFELGEKVAPITSVALKQSKITKHLVNAANYKARTISRNKSRDKRSASLIC